ncbi:Sodium/hydrogen exchanger 2, partial [Mucuna pruriens]
MGSELSYALSKLQMVSTSDYASVVSMNLFVALLCACIVIGHLLEENRWVNESITALLIGLCTGVVILLMSRGKSSHILVKKKQFFVNFMTIILFGAVGTLISCTIITFGVTQIFKRMGVGKSLEMGDYLAIGAIFAATDSVCTLQVLNQDETPLLYSLVFGEGVVNDATSVVLFNAIKSFDLDQIDHRIGLHFIGNFLYLFTASTLLGVLAGLLSAYIIKKLYHIERIVFTIVLSFSSYYDSIPLFYILFAVPKLKKLLTQYHRHSTDREVALMMLMAYLSYILAECFVEYVFLELYIYLLIIGGRVLRYLHVVQLWYLSGILTVFFCGIVMSHYTWHNVTENSRITTKHAFASLSFVLETFIFLYVGMDALDIEKWRFVSDRPGTSVAVSSVLLGLVLAGRAAFVFPLSFLSNLTRKSTSERISFREQVIIWWAGLMRGAVSMALAYNQFTLSGHTELRTNAIMITSTITVVLVSTMVFGLMTKPLIRFLLPGGPPPKRKNSIANIDDSSNSPKSITVPFLGGSQDSENDFDSNEIHRPSNIRALLTTPTHTVHRLWRMFDNSIMRPVFGGRGFVPVVPTSPAASNGNQQWH